MIFVEIFHDFGWFFATRIRFIEADPDPADQNETDPDPQHCLKDLSIHDFFLSPTPPPPGMIGLINPNKKNFKWILSLCSGCGKLRRNLQLCQELLILFVLTPFHFDTDTIYELIIYLR